MTRDQRIQSVVETILGRPAFPPLIEALSKLIDEEIMREVLAKKIAEQDAVRGRPLTDQERLRNLRGLL